MLTLLDDAFAPLTTEVGFLRVPLEKSAEALVEWRHDLGRDPEVSVLTGRLVDLLPSLEPLTGGTPPRELLVETTGGWTAYFDAGIAGGDPESALGHLTRTHHWHGIAVTAQPHTVGTRLEVPGRYGAVRFQLFGPLETHFLNYVRTVSVQHDGSRWEFSARGVVQDFEETEAYNARKVRDRFTSEMLTRYCRALDVEVFDPEFYAPQAALVETTLPRGPDIEVLPLAEVQRTRGIVPTAARQVPG